MAVKIARQPKKIALIGAPSSAAAFLPGSEKAPAALRAAGLVERLQGAGFEVIDYGDCAPAFSLTMKNIDAPVTFPRSSPASTI